MTSPTQHTVGLLLFPRFQLLAYVMATETLRLANKVAGRSVFRWETLGQNGAPVAASSGVPVVPSGLVANAGDLSLLLLCAGYDPLAEVSESTKALLRKRAHLGGMLGGLDTGTVILAELGLLAGYRAVVHFEAETGFRETYPEISLETAIYALDRERLTAAGGTATGDAMLAWIANVTSPELAARTAEALIHGSIRPAGAPQRQSKRAQGNPHFRLLVALMKDHLEEPLAMDEIARRSGLGKRRIQALFLRHGGKTPSAYYLDLRLDRARDLLSSTTMSASAVGVASGFTSPEWFCRAFRKRFGLPPLQHRKLLLSGIGAGRFD